MKYLVGIPCLYGAAHTKEAIDSAKLGADVLCIDNGAEEGVRKVIEESGSFIIRNEKNIYVNPAWNQIMQYFIENREYDVLCVMNSDLILPVNWNLMLDEFYLQTKDSVPIPNTINDKTKIGVCNHNELILEQINGGIAGIFICLTREQCDLVYPIPSYIQVWYGDDWIYDILGMDGLKTMLIKNMEVYHAISQNVSRVKGIGEIIEQDRQGWVKYSEKSKIDKLTIKK